MTADSQASLLHNNAKLLSPHARFLALTYSRYQAMQDRIAEIVGEKIADARCRRSARKRWRPSSEPALRGELYCVPRSGGSAAGFSCVNGSI